MTPILADAIDIPVVLLAGVIVLAPLLAFNVFVEAFILKKCWQLPYRQLCGFAVIANLWSLLAGIPTKILNSYLYDSLLPADIPGFFASYPLALAIGSLVYFAVTLLVEGLCASVVSAKWTGSERRRDLARNPIRESRYLRGAGAIALLDDQAGE